MSPQPIPPDPASNFKRPTEREREYQSLSLRDLLDARDSRHVSLMRDSNVVATAVGYYRIRIGDSWPGAAKEVRVGGVRMLENSQVRPYSWPAVLVFVREWKKATDFGGEDGYNPDYFIDREIELPDGRRIPVCVIQAPPELEAPAMSVPVRYPVRPIGTGHPVTVDLQGREHFATVACIVTDGHRSYALTNRHVTGEAGLVIHSPLSHDSRIGVSAPLQETRALLSDVYPGWAGRNSFINLDVGLIDVDDLNDWTTRLPDGSRIGPMVDLSSTTFPLSLVGARVRGWGAAGGYMEGEIHGLFYRYKAKGGFEYVSDFFIGPRETPVGVPPVPFQILPGDSGMLWLLEPKEEDAQTVGPKEGVKAGPKAAEQSDKKKAAEPEWRPLAMQWGANRLYSALSSQPRAYALATCLSTICERLDVDIVRDWNYDDPNTWGAVGHFAIASRAAAVLSDTVPKLKSLMKNNARIISPADGVIRQSDFKGMGEQAFVHLADVPDFFWKHGKQGSSRGIEGPNHFADMDQPRPSDHETLLKLWYSDPAYRDPHKWNAFYDQVRDLGTGEKISMQHRGLLPFRVWQIFKKMVEFAKPGTGDVEKFVCAAGVLAHYVGDSCQPLHISYLHDGDPKTGKHHTVHHIKDTPQHRAGTTSDVIIPRGAGVHAAYEDDMVNSHRDKILQGLDAKSTPVTPAEYIQDGKAAAERLVDLMKDTFADLPPIDIVNLYVAQPDKKHTSGKMWSKFGSKTIDAMTAGTHLLAVLWESAWVKGGGEGAGFDTGALTQKRAMKICADPKFLPSCSIADVGGEL